ncbi:MAG: hypothetical protein ACYC99_17330, partial [Candidatus Geothermincolia bacterium]
MRYHGKHRELHSRGQLNLAIPVLAAALATLIITTVLWAGGSTQGLSELAKTSGPRTSPTPCPSPLSTIGAIRGA